MTENKTLFAALERARKNFGEIKKTKINPHFKSAYAPLDEILDAVQGPLAAEGISIISFVRAVDSGWELVTSLCLIDAQELNTGTVVSSSFPLPHDVANPQKIGSAIKYGRRYNLTALLNLEAEDDDDGNAASPAPAQATKSGNEKTLTAMKKELDGIFGEGGLYDKDDQGGLTGPAKLKLAVLEKTFGISAWRKITAMPEENFMAAAKANFRTAIDEVKDSQRTPEAEAAKDDAVPF